MRLERLEINGFKSFSDRSELAFDKGVTAIVGPNGCGKSNVADAITWVMGEQSAKSLRGERMEDIIFNGSDARKPTATAEVRLRLSGVMKSGPDVLESPNGVNGHHENGHETNGQNGHSFAGGGEDEVARLVEAVVRDVEVTRRLYRSGDSEYLIDGHVCRLRDVHELLMDTGLGAKAYAIIEQGKIGLILSSRPTDRRQLIEEAAGVTKYKSRRRTAELKLEAARQNLSRVDDIVFEVEKQRTTLKRQAAKARRYQKLRDELRRWEKVLFARKYRQLASVLGSTRARLATARERDAAASARVAQLESDLARIRIELVEAESRATASRESAHACEMAMTSRQQQLAFDREQIQIFDARGAVLVGELEALEARREPARAELEARRAAAAEAIAERNRAERTVAEDVEAYDAAHRAIEGLEADVEAARSEVFSAINAATALRHALEHAASARERVADRLAKLDVEANDVRHESERVAAERDAAAANLRRLHEEMEANRIARAARESELASARIEHEWRARSVRAREHELAGLNARLKSLEELDAARAEYGDGARTVLSRANGHVNQRGAVADYLEVQSGHERAVEAFLGDLLQYVVVERSEHAEAGLQFLREQSAGRCGFLIASGGAAIADLQAAELPVAPDGLWPLSTSVRMNGPYADAIRQAVGSAWIAGDYDHAAAATRVTSLPIATMAGEVFRGPHVVTGGARDEARGILETKREIKELRTRVRDEGEELTRLAEETAGFETAIAQASNGVAALGAEQHRFEKAIVGYEAQLQRAGDEAEKLRQKGEQLARERRQAEDEREALNSREVEARESISRLEGDQQLADERLTVAQRRIIEAREAAENLNRQTAEAGAAHATLVERAAAFEADLRRLEEAAAELEARARTLTADVEQVRQRLESLRASVTEGESHLDSDAHALDGLQHQVHSADEAVLALRERAVELEDVLKEARTTLDSTRATLSDLDVARATSESELSYLSQACLESVQSTLDDVVVEVERMEQQGDATPDGHVVFADDGDEGTEDAVEGEGGAVDQAVRAAEQRTLTAEEAIAHLRTKIERLGAVNMMAIEQFDELETRHNFLMSQRNDLVDSIDQTTSAIKRIDETTRQRFAEAFTAINTNFQTTFSTLFGGGRAGLTLLDESDPLESGIEIIAQPPGKRLQSVQLLSGGEKALTAIALMFGLFQFKPSPFCLLDEIDAPLDDANIGRFVEMLRGMQQHTQFILITHNRKTMEIADRLYGVTMEEPGVSKLISVQLN